MQGRKPKTTAQHMADGTYNVTRHGSRLNVPPSEKIPEPPKHYDAAHRKEWADICQALNQIGQLTVVDTYAIQTFVEARILATTTYQTILAEGMVVDGRKNPAHLIYAEAVKPLRSLYDEFGLTPLARTRLKTEEPAEGSGDPLDFLDN